MAIVVSGKVIIHGVDVSPDRVDGGIVEDGPGSAL
jgi:hypothetical protein